MSTPIQRGAPGDAPDAPHPGTGGDGGEPLVSVRGLRISFPSRRGAVEAVRGIDFDLGREKLGIVGESGSGKSVACRALLGLVPSPGIVTADRLMLFGQDFSRSDPAGWRSVRGGRVGLVMQDPRYSLNPVLTVGAQMCEALALRRNMRGAAARDEGLALLEAVRLRDPMRVWRAHPHELSGGMGQRAMIAMMLAMQPEILIADEPTSALDVTVAGEILELLDSLVRDRGMALVLVSHDLRMVQAFCDRVLVMYAGRVLDRCAASDLERSAHPYTRGLLDCAPSLDRPRAVLPVLERDASWAR
jgi:peptide/nickel transport system ATP-binding protein